MEEAQKMAALKKAYADIILNTAKEAATRIMVSERKALHFQQDLFAAKEEALNMLLRLKQMMDSKIAEAEAASLSERRRIEELEAQLHEAEDMVRDLREELKGVQDELGKVKNNPVQSLNEHIVKGSTAYHEDASQEKKLNASESILLPPLDSGPGSISTSDMKDAPLNQRNTDDRFVSENAATRTEPLSNSLGENYYAGNPDLASIIMRSKEPELYRNGCTQRIRAFERNPSNGNLPLSGETVNLYSHLKNESIIREDETAEDTCTVAPAKDDNIVLMKKNLTGLEELLQQDNNCDKNQAVKFLRRFSSRKRKSRSRKTKATICTEQVMKAHEPSNLSRCKTYPCTDNNMVEFGEDPSRIIEKEALVNSDSLLAPVSSLKTTNVDPQSGCTHVTGSDPEVLKAGSVLSVAHEDTVLSRQDSEVVGSSRVPVCKLNLETVDVPLMNTDSKDDKNCETTNGASTQTVNDRLLKYTFRRKRKKESLSIPDENASIEKNNSKRRSGEKQSSATEPLKSNLLESPRDNRRIMQVARQLISLSEKRWW